MLPSLRYPTVTAAGRFFSLFWLFDFLSFLYVFVFLVSLFLSARGELSSGTVHQKCQQILNQRRGGSVLFIRQEGKLTDSSLLYSNAMNLIGFMNFSANSFCRLFVGFPNFSANQRNQQLHDTNYNHVTTLTSPPAKLTGFFLVA